MKKTFTMLAVIVIVGCGDDAEARETGRTFNQAIAEVKSSNRMVVVPNTEHIDYATYRAEWRLVNNKPAPRWAPDFTLTTKTRKDPEDVYETVEIELNDLAFKEAFRLEFLGKGEGHTFWWRGHEYTTNLLDVIRGSGFTQTDPFIEKIEKIVKENPTTPIEVVPTLEEE